MRNTTTKRGNGTGRRIALILSVLAVMGLLVSGCSAVREVELKTVSKTRVVKLKDARSVRADIAMDAGELQVDGKADELLKAKFRYGSGFGEPQVEYRVRGDTGGLFVRSRKKRSPVFASGMNNRWDLSLTDKVPIELSIDLGAGNTNLALADLDLEELDVSGGAGNLVIDLSGGWGHDVDVSIDQGLGNLKVLLPKDFGVRVDVDLGLGNFKREGLKRDGAGYINDAFEDGQDLLNIRIDQGAGQIDLEVVD